MNTEMMNKFYTFIRENELDVYVDSEGLKVENSLFDLDIVYYTYVVGRVCCGDDAQNYIVASRELLPLEEVGPALLRFYYNDRLGLLGEVYDYKDTNMPVCELTTLERYDCRDYSLAKDIYEKEIVTIEGKLFRVLLLDN